MSKGGISKEDLLQAEEVHFEGKVSHPVLVEIKNEGESDMAKFNDMWVNNEVPTINL